MTEFPFNTLSFTRLDFIISADTTIYLPAFKGSVFRGAFGALLRSLFNFEAQEQHFGIYSQIFERKSTPEERAKLKIGIDSPRGYIIEPPMTTQRKFEPGETLSFSILLAGKLASYTHIFVLIIEQMGRRNGIGSASGGKRGKFTLKEVHNNGVSIYNSARGSLSLDINPFPFNPGSPSESLEDIEFELNFISPARFERNGERVYIDGAQGFKTFFINLYRHLFLLNSLYCNGPAEFYPSPLEDLSGKVLCTGSDIREVELERPARNRGSRDNSDGVNPDRIMMKYDGFTGSIKFRGPVSPFLPYIRLGEHLHAGKHTTFGFGKFELIMR